MFVIELPVFEMFPFWHASLLGYGIFTCTAIPPTGSTQYISSISTTWPILKIVLAVGCQKCHHVVVPVRWPPGLTWVLVLVASVGISINVVVNKSCIVVLYKRTMCWMWKVANVYSCGDTALRYDFVPPVHLLTYWLSRGYRGRMQAKRWGLLILPCLIQRVSLSGDCNEITSAMQFNFTYSKCILDEAVYTEIPLRTCAHSPVTCSLSCQSSNRSTWHGLRSLHICLQLSWWGVSTIFMFDVRIAVLI